MPSARIAIVGAGLAGLYAAYLLERQGIHDYLLFEARPRPGGRILCAPAPAIASAPDCAGRHDLGPAWFWPDVQPELDRVIRELGLTRYAQQEAGAVMVERSPDEAPVRMRGYAGQPASMRLAGGMEALTGALLRQLDAARVLTGLSVRGLDAGGPRVRIDSVAAGGAGAAHDAEQVLLAVPPRLAESRIAFTPALPPALARQWRATATWMAPHAKYVAVYDSPFWLEQGLSGEARSACGPLGEIHDASVPGGAAALFGFFGVPAAARASVGQDRLLALCRAQMQRLFGPQAAAPRQEFIKDWAQDACTATGADRSAPAAGHAIAPAAEADSGPWAGRMRGIASEWAPTYPGYLAGAIEAAALGVRALGPVEKRRTA
jgi:monoamine oxidase